VAVLILSMPVCTHGIWRNKIKWHRCQRQLAFHSHSVMSSKHSQKTSRSAADYAYQRITQWNRLQSLRKFSSACQAVATSGWINAQSLDDDCRKPYYNEHNNSAVIICEDNIDDEDKQGKHSSSSPVERLLIRDRIVYIKRDDLLVLPGSRVSGNKARKFLSLNNMQEQDFPDAIVSYGGPQSNAMVALAAIVSSKNIDLAGQISKSLAKDEQRSADVDNCFAELDVFQNDRVRKERMKRPSPIKMNPKYDKLSRQKRFVYYTKTLPRYLKSNASGNLLRAMALGMELRTLPHNEYNELFGGLHGGSVMAPADLDPPVPGRSLWIPQGGACSIAQPGADVLAKEILDFWSSHGKGMPLAVCIPGGTCTTALLLHRSINKMLQERQQNREAAMDIKMVVIPCIGDDEYAMRQMLSLDKSVGGRGKKGDMPTILRPRSDVEYGGARKKTKGYFRFGEPTKAILDTFDELNRNGLFLDLLYGAPAWSLLLQHWRSRDDDCPIAGRQVMYVHSGGLEGIASQMTRYKHKGLIV